MDVCSFLTSCAKRWESVAETRCNSEFAMENCRSRRSDIESNSLVPVRAGTCPEEYRSSMNYGGIEEEKLRRPAKIAIEFPGAAMKTQDVSTPVSAPQERKARSWGPRISRVRPTDRKCSARRGPAITPATATSAFAGDPDGNAREPSSAQHDRLGLRNETDGKGPTSLKHATD